MNQGLRVEGLSGAQLGNVGLDKSVYQCCVWLQPSPPRPSPCVCTNRRARQVPDANLAHVRRGCAKLTQTLVWLRGLRDTAFVSEAGIGLSYSAPSLPRPATPQNPPRSITSLSRSITHSGSETAPENQLMYNACSLHLIRVRYRQTLDQFTFRGL